MSARTTARHADWLSLVEPTGPFVTLPVLRRALPEGLERTRPELRSELRDRVDNLGREPGARQDFVGWVLRDLLGFGEQVREGQAVPDACTTVEQVHHVTLRPNLAVLDRHEPSRPRLLVSVYPAGASLTAHLAGERWAASPVDRMTTLCRSVGCVLGLVTDGERFTLVWAPATGPVGRATWVASIFAEGSERNLLDSFTTLLGAKRFFAASPENRLEALLAESARAQADVTGQLGLQVRRATELLVAALSRADREAEARFLAGIEPHTVYEAAATVMMRLIFLLYAEERRLLPLGDELYDASYAASTLREVLREAADRIGDDALEHRMTAWPRLLATFRAVYSGLAHDRVRIPPYGGRLFDPDRYPFLEGRKPGDSWRSEPSTPISVDDRSMLGMLDAIQMLETREGGATEKRRLAFRALDVEQIGHVYEGLLDHSAVAIASPTLGLVGKAAGSEPEVTLDDLEAHARRGREVLGEWLHEKTEKSKPYIYKQLECELDDDRSRLILAACDNDPQLAKRVEPFAFLVRDDLRGMPIVLPRGSMYVTETSHRRDTGTEYTPRELADEVVEHALEPLVYEPGPANEPEPARWKLKSSEAILNLRVCDPAVGSGAFLVSACRFLADRVVEAWTEEKSPLVGQLSAQVPPEGEVDDLTIEARRRVAERCLFGVDRDPMAVEMAKLSLWLTTMARERPFSFLDHAIQSGDSLLGVTDLEQVLRFHMDPEQHKQLPLTGSIIPKVESAVRLRERIEDCPVRDIGDAERKASLVCEAETALVPIKIIADLIVGASLLASIPRVVAFADEVRGIEDEVIAAFAPNVSAATRTERLQALKMKAAAWLNAGRPKNGQPRSCLHWPLAFPEVFRAGGGFDAFVGNPPYLHGTGITATLGEDVKLHIARTIAKRTTNRADLVAFFFLRAASMSSSINFLATASIAKGDSREVSLDPLLASGWRISRAVSNVMWPGSAAVSIAKIWMVKRELRTRPFLDGKAVAIVSAGLTEQQYGRGQFKVLRENKGVAFSGCKVDCTGFVIADEEARQLIADNPKNAEVVRPYLTSDDLYGTPSASATRWVIDFGGRVEVDAREYSQCWALVEERVRAEVLARKGEYASWASRWWQFWRVRPGLRTALEGRESVVVIGELSKSGLPMIVSAEQVLSHRLVVFALGTYFDLGVLSSSFHWLWVVEFGPRRDTRLGYASGDCFEPFPRPVTKNPEVGAAAEALDSLRRRIASARRIGITEIYNDVHDESCADTEIVALRQCHVRLDRAVAKAYQWDDIPLVHGFAALSIGRRFTLMEKSREKAIARLVDLNRARYETECSSGYGTRKKRIRGARPAESGGEQGVMFEPGKESES